MTSFYNMPVMLVLLIIAMAGGYSLYRVFKINQQLSIKKENSNIEKFKDVSHKKYEHWVLENHKGHREVIKHLFKILSQRKNLFRRDRPFFTAVFSGPTGTGKTYLAGLISEVIYKNTKPIDINMGRLKSPQDGNILCEMILNYVEKNGPCLIILNEIDKCHQEVLHSLYTVLDTGKLYHAIHHTEMDLSHCSIIATSNYGVEDLNTLIKSNGRVPDRVDILNILSNKGKFEKSFLARFDAQYFLPSLENISVAEVVLIECCKYWRSHGVIVEYLGADLILKIITKNEKYHEYGVRELERIVRETMDEAIVTAKNSQAKKIRLETDGLGNIKIKSYVGRNNAA